MSGFYRAGFAWIIVVLLAITFAFIILQNSDEQKYQKTKSSALNKRACSKFHSDTFTVACFYYFTHHNHSTDTVARGFKLPLALIKRNNDSATPLIVKIPGGPGEGFQTTHDSIESYLLWMDEIDAQFDLLVYDPRGTGESDPRGVCPEYDEASQHIFAANVTLAEESEQLKPVLLRCLRQLQQNIKNILPASQQGNPFQAMSSFAQAADIVGMARVLSYDKVHLWGTSYGTRVALLAAHYPEVKTLILDSPYPLEKGKLTDWVEIFANVLDIHSALFSKYFASEDFESLFYAISHRLTEKPLSLRAENWYSNEEVDFVLNAERFYMLNVDVLYSIEPIRNYYEGLMQFSKDGTINEHLQEAINQFVTTLLFPEFYYLVNFTTECMDNALVEEAVFLQAIEELPKPLQFMRDFWIHDICRTSMFNERMPVHAAPYTSKPSLIFVGQYDPVTTVKWAKELHQQLPVSSLTIVPDLGHGVLGWEVCQWEFLNEFIQQGDEKKPFPQIHCTKQ